MEKGPPLAVGRTAGIFAWGEGRVAARHTGPRTISLMPQMTFVIRASRSAAS